MSNFGPAEFGPAVFGGDPASSLLLEVDAEVTTIARRFIARSTTDGTAFKTIEFSLGQGGTDPFDYKTTVPVNPDAQSLELPISIPMVTLPGTLSTIASDTTIGTSEDLTTWLRPGYQVEVTTASGIETLVVSTVSSTEFTVTTDATWTDPIATGTIEPYITGAKNITEYEHANEHSGTTYCVVTPTEANEALSEIGIWGTVLWSPYTAEIGSTFLAAIAHFPLICKNTSMSYALRVNVQF